MRFTTLFTSCALIICVVAHPFPSNPQHHHGAIARGGDGTFNKHAAVDYTTYNTKPTQSPDPPKSKDDSSKPKPDAKQEDTGDRKMRWGTYGAPWKA